MEHEQQDINEKEEEDHVHDIRETLESAGLPPDPHELQELIDDDDYDYDIGGEG